ncbi:uncharacterized protein LOC131469618 [Solea solea]|uniref:uncharacterized protein LOC131469618 n=1 Tax=Solea solea TaxID=90069 RepID=UPI00272D1479|nr:uncharacterized protein LOC131469618 [Solea solea]XP_058500763.1 uncharacterized protein LOC131469618 [Solea solea]
MDKNLCFEQFSKEKWRPSSYFESDPYQMAEFEKILKKMVVKKTPPVEGCLRRTEHKDLDDTYGRQDFQGKFGAVYFYWPAQPEAATPQPYAKDTKETNIRQNSQKTVDPDENTEAEEEAESEQEPETQQQNDLVDTSWTLTKVPKNRTKQSIVCFPEQSFCAAHEEPKLQNDTYSSMVRSPKNVKNPWLKGNPWSRTAVHGERSGSQLEPDLCKNWSRGRITMRRMQKRMPELPTPSAKTQKETVLSPKTSISSAPEVKTLKDQEAVLLLQQDDLGEPCSVKVKEPKEGSSRGFRTTDKKDPKPAPELKPELHLNWFNGKIQRRRKQKRMRPSSPDIPVTVQSAETLKNQATLYPDTCPFSAPVEETSEDQDISGHLNWINNRIQKRRKQRRKTPPRQEPFTTEQSMETLEKTSSPVSRNLSIFSTSGGDT